MEQKKRRQNDTARLARILKFTPQQLKTNLHGKLADSQYKELYDTYMRQTLATAIPFLLVLMIPTGLFWAVTSTPLIEEMRQLPQEDIDMAEQVFRVIVFGVLFGLFFAGRALYKNVRTLRMIRKRTVQVYDGVVRRVKEQNDYKLSLGEDTCTVSEEVFETFKDGNRYRVCYISSGNELLSVQAF